MWWGKMEGFMITGWGGGVWWFGRIGISVFFGIVPEVFEGLESLRVSGSSNQVFSLVPGLLLHQKARWG